MILHVACLPFPTHQGTQAAIASMLEASTRVGRPSHLLAYAHAAYELDTPYEIHRIPNFPVVRSVRSGPSWGKVALDARCIVETRRLVRRLQPSAIIAHHIEAALAALAARVAPVYYVAHTSLERELPVYMPRVPARPVRVHRAAIGGAGVRTGGGGCCRRARACHAPGGRRAIPAGSLVVVGGLRSSAARRGSVGTWNPARCAALSVCGQSRSVPGLGKPRRSHLRAAPQSSERATARRHRVGPRSRSTARRTPGRRGCRRVFRARIGTRPNAGTRGQRPRLGAKTHPGWPSGQNARRLRAGPSGRRDAACHGGASTAGRVSHRIRR